MICASDTSLTGMKVRPNVARRTQVYAEKRINNVPLYTPGSVSRNACTKREAIE
jgi:hypothetical protein